MIEGKGEKDMTRVFMQAYRTALTKSVEYIFAKCYEYAPVGKHTKGAVNLRNALKWDFDWSEGAGYIGLPKGSEMELIAFAVEMGTGIRGKSNWKQYFEEKKPQFTVPIVPTTAKVMHWVDPDTGADHFLRVSKGQKPQAFMRRAFYDSQDDVKMIWEKEFSDANIASMLKMKKA